MRYNLHVVLIEPQIPYNTGNIGRLCVATNSKLHLVGKLGFSLNDKYLKRAGLDYWSFLDYEVYKNFEEFVERNKNGRFIFVESPAFKLYTEVSYQEGDYLIFGSEDYGIPSEIIEKYWENSVTIPMFGPVRSLNLSSSVAVVVYEALRQIKKF
ncbi:MULTISPECIES: tRNA (cytidine(34)-2'-O)-methyltransferase [Dictyoglomus]|jgi:tRNA (cytidine/uridine-2'-O-)-methyltransferase|uniref:tRNA (cytidine(34)-2'-O)-methyltransferase n=1 Tax=Dictyoglomus TaxID=13 RepID=UPI000CCF9F53|nr:tRNA (cytidine(34)-2'-O)-methyltransferase [Dictyoglomus turgidum]PNV79147.1 MAG: tRNA (uridine(34)/cytosine(34)/5-carboxymethylaminomethyluridine(34)-2'-O)-methyltransferase TrmL [Dictyoglomus turgidum]